MFKFKASTLIAFSGFVWLAVGLYLLPLGLNFLILSAQVPERNAGFLLNSLSSLLSYEQAALLLVVIGLSLGYMKGKTVFAKTVRKSVARILSFSPPIALGKVYSIGYVLLLALMVLIGLSFKFLGVTLDLRGLVDVAIGSALINGSLLYFRQARLVKEQEALAA